MPSKKATERAHKDAREGKSPSTQAGEFVKEEIDKIRKGEHGARNTKQAIAIGLSEARRAGVKLPPRPGSNSKNKSSSRHKTRHSSAQRSTATLNALKREPASTASPQALSKHAAAARRGPKARHESAMKAVKTKGHAAMKRAARKAAHTREIHAHR